MNDIRERWEYMLEVAFDLMLKDPNIVGPNGKELREHLKDTPRRLVKSFQKDFFKGAMIDARSVLSTSFTNKKYDEVIIIANIDFTSFCMHHALPFVGQAHFGYMPTDKIVGLSKIPRLVDVLSRRLQVQENLTQEIVDIFMEVVEPVGCGIIMEAVHTCMSVRGIQKQGAITETTALRGKFKEASLKAEFLAQIAPRKGK